MLLYLILAAMVAHISCDPRIIGGTDSTPGQFPYVVALMLNSEFYCGGSIISEYFILTAAHCTVNVKPSEMIVLAGLNDLTLANSTGKALEIDKIIIHPGFQPPSYDFDLSLIKLVKRLELGSPYIDKIKLVSAGTCLPPLTVATVSGFGANNANLDEDLHLKYVRIPLVHRIICEYFFNITDRMFCAGLSHGQENSCPGDSGGPLVVRNKLAGVVSWGLGCGLRAPVVYAKVAVMRSWIRKVSGV